MDWYPQQLFTAEQVAAGTFGFTKKTGLCSKGVFWGPQALFTAEQAAADIILLEKQHAFFEKFMFWSNT